MNWLLKLFGRASDEPVNLNPPGLTVERMREMEDSLTPEQKAWAFAYAQRLGWSSFNNPPMWVWNQIFMEAKMAVPAPKPVVH